MIICLLSGLPCSDLRCGSFPFWVPTSTASLGVPNGPFAFSFLRSEASKENEVGHLMIRPGNGTYHSDHVLLDGTSHMAPTLIIKQLGNVAILSV